MAYAWGRGFVGRDRLVPSRVAQPEGTPVRPWAIAEDKVKVAASAGHVEVAFFLPKWPPAPGHCAGGGAVTGGAGCGVPVIHFGRSVRATCPSAPPVRQPSAAKRVRLKMTAYGHTTEHRLRVRARVVLHAARGRSNACIAREAGLHVDTVRRWRGRFAQAGLLGLKDRQRCGRPASFTPLQAAQVKAPACRLPAQSEVPLSRWSCPEPVRAAARRGIAPFMSASTVRRRLAQDALNPWQHRSWTSCWPGSTGTPPITERNPLSHRQREQPPKDLRHRSLSRHVTCGRNVTDHRRSEEPARGGGRLRRRGRSVRVRSRGGAAPCVPAAVPSRVRRPCRG
ncbi:homeodomain-containing protein [Streptomyces sp. TLI_235]|nr:homeodomain-containing protein [Streptomyces sp. TLI_235]